MWLDFLVANFDNHGTVKVILGYLVCINIYGSIFWSLRNILFIGQRLFCNRSELNYNMWVNFYFRKWFRVTRIICIILICFRKYKFYGFISFRLWFYVLSFLKIFTKNILIWLYFEYVDDHRYIRIMIFEMVLYFCNFGLKCGF